MTEEEYDNNITFLTTSISDNNCILFIGPGLLTAKEPAEPLIEIFCEKLINELKKNDASISFDKTMDVRSILMFYLQEKTKKYSPIQKPLMKMVEINKLLKGLEEFSRENLYISDFHKKLAKMPFKLVINVTPDEKLYNELFKSYDFGVYDFSNDQQKKVELPDVSKKKVFYNLFGSFHNPQSVPITETDFIKITTCLIKDTPAIHHRVKNILEENSSFLFLGFDFNSWYLKVLMNILKVVGGINLENSFFPIPKSDRDFFTNEHGFSFISKGFEPFVEDIYEKITPQVAQQTVITKKRLLLLFDNETDKGYEEEFENIMKPIAEIIHQNNILLGENSVEDKLKEALINADLVMILSSSTFFTSDICIKLLKIAETNNKKIVNILLKSCLYEEGLRGILQNYPASIEATLPRENKAITEMADTPEKRASYFTKISEEIKNM